MCLIKSSTSRNNQSRYENFNEERRVAEGGIQRKRERERQTDRQRDRHTDKVKTETTNADLRI